jgi:hypothetical protein
MDLAPGVAKAQKKKKKKKKKKTTARLSTATGGQVEAKVRHGR